MVICMEKAFWNGYGTSMSNHEVNGANPQAVYTARLAKRQSVVDALEQRSLVCSWLRMAVFALGIVAVTLALVLDTSFAWIVAPVMMFVGLVIYHDGIIRQKERALRAVAFYRSGLDRLACDWEGKGIVRDDFAPADHPYATDLDLFGKGSLFDLVCTARTSRGEHYLARWLLDDATAEEIAARQTAVEELRDRLDFREELSLVGGTTRSLIHGERLTKWAQKPPVFGPKALRQLRFMAWFMAVCAAVGIVLAFTTEFGLLLLVIIGVIEYGIARLLRNRVDAIIVGTEGPSRELLIFSKVLSLLEKETLESPLLKEQKAQLSVNGVESSRSIEHLGQLVNSVDQAKNQLFAPVAFFLMWRTHFALRIESWRQIHGAAVPRWLQSSGKIDALTAMSGYAYENPLDPFPIIEPHGPVYLGEKLGHPLISREMCVRNSVHLDASCPLWVVSGSNMSGKSTFLRVVGINAVLANAGLPVRAESLRISPLSVGATIRIIDSLQAGKSKFYAEISAIKRLVDTAREKKQLLFLLDEILHGTNSHDRKIGAASILRGLLDLGAIGLVTTHDLALAEAADALGGKARNVHFDDQMENGELRFDYTVKPGIVKKSNALELMRSVGLDIG
jgi:hypothetical protein